MVNRHATGAILAGGTSRRMGRNKLALDLGGKPLIQHVSDVLDTCCAEVLIVGNETALSPPGRSIPDARPGGHGPLAGIEAALLAARSRAVFVAAGDMPFLSGALVRGLLDLLVLRGPVAVVPRRAGRVHPLCAAYDRDAALPAVRAALDRGEYAARDMLENLPDVLYVGGEDLRAFGEPARLLANVNTPEDLERTLAMIETPKKLGW